MYSSYALPFYDIVLLGFSVWNLFVFFFGWESDTNRHKDRSMASGVQWRKCYLPRYGRAIALVKLWGHDESIEAICFLPSDVHLTPQNASGDVMGCTEVSNGILIVLGEVVDSWSEQSGNYVRRCIKERFWIDILERGFVFNFYIFDRALMKHSYQFGNSAFVTVCGPWCCKEKKWKGD